MQNRLWNCKNPFQGDFEKVLCVCSAGLLRSPTLAWVLGNPPYNFNTRAVGIDEGHALIPMDLVHLKWADTIIAVESGVRDSIVHKFSDDVDEDSLEIITLNLPDNFEYRDEGLVRNIHLQLEEKLEGR